jgi:dolichyl-diphosphooligosaccharide--protein glycosyltransferase
MYESRQFIGTGMTSHMSRSMMFKMCYHNFAKFVWHPQLPPAFDMARQTEVPNLKFTLSKFEEAFTSQHWIVRIYRVMPDPLWDRLY